MGKAGSCAVIKEPRPAMWGLLYDFKTTRVSLAAAHRDHDPTHNRLRNLVALCQRCHMIRDAKEHQRRRWSTLFHRKASGDLFS
jgi:hypothetical protein